MQTNPPNQSVTQDPALFALFRALSRAILLRVIFIIVFLVAGILLAQSIPELNWHVRWIQSPLTVRAWTCGTNCWESDGIAFAAHNPDIEIGLRDDGVVVWRKRK